MKGKKIPDSNRRSQKSSLSEKTRKGRLSESNEDNGKNVETKEENEKNAGTLARRRYQDETRARKMMPRQSGRGQRSAK